MHQGELDILSELEYNVFNFFHLLFLDTEHERNALMEVVYPKLREFCQKKGYEFQVNDIAKNLLIIGNLSGNIGQNTIHNRAVQALSRR